MITGLYKGVLPRSSWAILYEMKIGGGSFAFPLFSFAGDTLSKKKKLSEIS